MQQIDDIGFQAGEAEIVGAALHFRFRQLERLCIAALRRLIDMNAARIRKSHCARAFIKAFARGIVTRPADRAECRIVQHLRDARMSAADDQAEIGRLQNGLILRRRNEIIRGGMTLGVMHRDQRLAGHHRESLCKAHADQQRTDQPRRIGHGDAVHIADRHIRIGQRLRHDRQDILTVPAGCQLRHDAAELLMLLRLRRDDIGKDASAVLNNSRRRFIAGAFNSQDPHIVPPSAVWRSPFRAYESAPAFRWFPDYPWKARAHRSFRPSRPHWRGALHRTPAF